MKKYAFIICFFFMTQPCLATWNWYAGDLVAYALYPPGQISQHYQEALDSHLDYRVFYNHPQDGHFVGLSDFLREETFNDPSLLTPILGTAVVLDSTQVIICMGVDPRSPIPKTTPQELQKWTTSQGGVAILTHLPQTIQNAFASPILFQAIHEFGWHPDSQVGGQWDSLLTQGHRIGIVGQASPTSHTYVWAESPQPDPLFAGFNDLSTIVSEANAIQLDFRVDEHPPGATLLAEANVNIRLSATSQAPIKHIQLIADGHVIWSATPETHTYSTRFQIPIDQQRYVRAVCQTEQHQTLTSPVYFESEFYATPIDLSLENVPIHITLDGVLESLSYLPPEAQARVVAEYISTPQTQFAMAFALENRSDIVSAPLMESLLESPFPQVRLGAAFVRVMRSAPTLSTYLPQLLLDPDPTIQAYAARMLLQYTTFQDASQLYDLIPRVDVSARHYLIQALAPTTPDPTIYRDLIHLSHANQAGVARAATAKLVDMGNRNFRVIRSLRDSAYAGHIISLEILGTIGDERVAKDVEKIYTQAPPSLLKNTAFRVLQTFYPEEGHYPDKPNKQDLGTTPLLDGTFIDAEWNGAAHIDHFVDDAHTGQISPNIQAWITRNHTHLLFAIKVANPDTQTVQHIELSLATTLAPQIPFVFTILPPTAREITPDPTLQLKQTFADTAWVVEGAIALQDLGLDPSTPIPYLHFNTALVTNKTRWTWTPTYGMPNNPKRFGIVNLHTPY